MRVVPISTGGCGSHYGAVDHPNITRDAGTLYCAAIVEFLDTAIMRQMELVMSSFDRTVVGRRIKDDCTVVRTPMNGPRPPPA